MWLWKLAIEELTELSVWSVIQRDDMIPNSLFDCLLQKIHRMMLLKVALAVALSPKAIDDCSDDQTEECSVEEVKLRGHQMAKCDSPVSVKFGIVDL